METRIKKLASTTVLILVILLCVNMLYGCTGKDATANVYDNILTFNEETGEGETTDGYVFYVNENKVKLAFYEGDETEIKIPDKIAGKAVVEIGPILFENSNIKTVNIPEGIEKIGFDAFKNCKELTTINIPNSVKIIEQGAFAGCASLKSITIPEGVQKIEIGTFMNCTSLETVQLPSSLTKIDREAFKNCYALQNIIIPSGVKEIGNKAFASCTTLASVSLPQKLENIDNEAFLDCSSLQTITIPGSIKALGEYVFRNCTSLSNIALPEKEFSAGNGIFDNTAWLASRTEEFVITGNGFLVGINMDENITEINVPEGVKYILTEDVDFKDLTIINLPSSIIETGDIFRNFEKLTTINVAEQNNEYHSIDGVLFSKDITKLLYYPKGKETDTFAIPEGVRILPNIFTFNNNLKTLILPTTIDFDFNDEIELKREEYNLQANVPYNIIIDFYLNATFNNLGAGVETIIFKCLVPPEVNRINQWFEDNKPNITVLWE